MRFASNTVKGTAFALSVVLLAGCATLEDRHGYIPDADSLNDVQVGLDTKDTVARILGAPGTEGIVDDRGWYYVRSDYERFLWRAPVEVDRQVLAVTFDETDRVSNIERFGRRPRRRIGASGDGFQHPRHQLRAAAVFEPW